MSLSIEIKLKELFVILKKNHFHIQSNMNQYYTIIEELFGMKLYPSVVFIKQIKSLLIRLKRQWNILKLKSSGPNYKNFNKMLESSARIYFTKQDIGKDFDQNILQIVSGFKNINFGNRPTFEFFEFSTLSNNNFIKKFKNLSLD